MKNVILLNEKYICDNHCRKSGGGGLISLDDLRDPAAFERMVAGVSEAIEKEKEKAKTGSGGKKKVPVVKKKEEEAKKVTLEVANNAEQQQQQQQQQLRAESPQLPRPVTPRRRIPSVKNSLRTRRGSGGNPASSPSSSPSSPEPKPPIPSEKSPPPPGDSEDEAPREEEDGGRFRFSSGGGMVNGHMDHEPRY